MPGSVVRWGSVWGKAAAGVVWPVGRGRGRNWQPEIGLARHAGPFVRRHDSS